MADITNLPCITKLNLTPERVLQAGLEAGLDGVVLMGYDRDGDLYFASSYADGGTVVWLMESCKKRLLEVQPPAFNMPPEGGADILPLKPEPHR